MARKRPTSAAGTLVVLEHESRILADNPLGDPHVRKLAVWLPPQYDEGAAAAAGAASRCSTTSSASPGRASRTSNWKPFGDNVPERAARLIHERRMGPAIIVFPDCFTALRRQPVRQLVGDRQLRRLPHARDRPVRRPRVPHARRARAPRLLRQVVGRLRRDHPRHEVRAALGRDRQPLGRRLLRLRLPPRLAEHARTSSRRYREPKQRAGAVRRCRRRPGRGGTSRPASTTGASRASSTPCGGRKSSPSARATRS